MRRLQLPMAVTAMLLREKGELEREREREAIEGAIEARIRAIEGAIEGARLLASD